MSFALDLPQKIQKLLNEPVISVEPYPGKDNPEDYLIKTKTSECHLVLPGIEGAFWKGMASLFHKDPADRVSSQIDITNFVNKVNLIKMPPIVQADASDNNPLGRPFFITELPEGLPASMGEEDSDTNIEANSDLALQLGNFFYHLHRDRFDYFGNFSGDVFNRQDFPEQFYNTLKMLGSRPNAKQNLDVQNNLAIYLKLASQMSDKAQHGLICLSVWPESFMSEQQQDQYTLSTFLNSGSFVIGPVGLELTLIELWLGNLGKFKEGYFWEDDHHWPDFEEERDLYRFFLYLLYDCPSKGLDACLNSSEKFPQGDRVRSRLRSPRPRPGGFPSDLLNPFNH